MGHPWIFVWLGEVQVSLGCAQDGLSAPFGAMTRAKRSGGMTISRGMGDVFWFGSGGDELQEVAGEDGSYGWAEDGDG
jgi:hypothetical protein